MSDYPLHIKAQISDIAATVNAIEAAWLAWHTEYDARVTALEMAFGIKAGFNPNQPRIPAGSSEGGQWVSGDRSIPTYTYTPRIQSDFTLPHLPFPGNKGTQFIRTIPDASGKRVNRINIFIGGLQDQSSHRNVLGSRILNRTTYGDNYYATHDQEDNIVAFIRSLPRNIEVNVIGHSYGGDTATKVSIALPKRMRALITIDPVSIRTKPTMQKVKKSARHWINVNAAGNSFTWGDLAALGGGKWRHDPKNHADIFFEAPYNHQEFTRMMEYLDENNNSPQNILNQRHK